VISAIPIVGNLAVSGILAHGAITGAERAGEAFGQGRYATGIFELGNAYLGAKAAGKHLGHGVSDVQGAWQRAEAGVAARAQAQIDTSNRVSTQLDGIISQTNIISNVLASAEARTNSGFRDFSQKASDYIVPSSIKDYRTLLKNQGIDPDNGFISVEALEHVFQGTTRTNPKNNKIKTNGLHYEASSTTHPNTYLEPSSITPSDPNGVYRAKVFINGTLKSGDQGYSSFFPKRYTATDVVKAGLEAYHKKSFVTPNDNPRYFEAVLSDGITIGGYYRDGKIQSYFPLYGR
jgi:Bacterial EndoU nuclease